MSTSKIMKLALIATATVAATIAFPAFAHADEHIQFASPSGNIRCAMDGASVSSPKAPLAMCEIKDYTYAPPPASAPSCEGSAGRGGLFELDHGNAAYLQCQYSALDSGIGPWPTLDFGQKESVGSITCDSEPSGVTCTDSSTGHFFRVSRESYQLG